MKVAIVGFGMMGRQIAQVFAQNGHDVAATDEDPESLSAGIREIENGPYGVRAATSRGRLTEDEALKVLGRIRTTSDLGVACKQVDLVVEAVFEDLELKQDLFRRIEAASPPSTLLASNTSTLSLAKIMAKVTGKERALGMHFFNPAQATKLVEVIRSDTTADKSLAQGVDIIRQIGKSPIVVKDEPGFVANRLGLALYIEASHLLEDKIADLADIDAAMKLGYGHPVGPFEVADLVGLDTRLRNLESLYRATGDVRWLAPKTLRQMVNQGYLGDPAKKKGSRGGYYEFFKSKR